MSGNARGPTHIASIIDGLASRVVPLTSDDRLGFEMDIVVALSELFRQAAPIEREETLTFRITWLNEGTPADLSRDFLAFVGRFAEPYLVVTSAGEFPDLTYEVLTGDDAHAHHARFLITR